MKNKIVIGLLLNALFLIGYFFHDIYLLIPLNLGYLWGIFKNE